MPSYLSKDSSSAISRKRFEIVANGVGRVLPIKWKRQARVGILAAGSVNSRADCP